MNTMAWLCKNNGYNTDTEKISEFVFKEKTSVSWNIKRWSSQVLGDIQREQTDGKEFKRKGKQEDGSDGRLCIHWPVQNGNNIQRYKMLSTEQNKKKNTSIGLFLSVKILFDSRLQIYWSDVSTTYCCMCWVLGGFEHTSSSKHQDSLPCPCWMVQKITEGQRVNENPQQTSIMTAALKLSLEGKKAESGSSCWVLHMYVVNEKKNRIETVH